MFQGLFTGPFYDKKDLIKNYEKREKEIYVVKDYINTITPDSIDVDIEFRGGMLNIFHVRKNGKLYQNWNMEVNSSKTDSLLSMLNWTKAELKNLKSKLKNAHCIGASNGNPSIISYQRSGMGMYSYTIFDQNLNDSLREKYNDGCTHIFYKENVVLTYGGGAIGPQCFEGYSPKKISKLSK